MGDKSEETDKYQVLDSAEYSKPELSRTDEAVGLDRKNDRPRKRGRPRMDIGQKESSDVSIPNRFKRHWVLTI